LLTSTNLKCWGFGYFGQLGRGATTDIGDDPSEMGDALPLLDFDGVTPTVTNTPTATNTPSITNTPSKTYTRSKTPTRSKTKTKTRTPTKSKTPTRTPVGYVSRVSTLDSGAYHTCAILASSVVKCWGANDSGQLGLGDTAIRGDASGDMGNALPVVNLGTDVIPLSIYAGLTHTCVVTTAHRVKCWGSNTYGELGLGDITNRGGLTSQMGDNLPYVDLGPYRTATALALGNEYTCALLDNATVTCWGSNQYGQLGIGSTDTIGDISTEMGEALLPVDIGTDRRVVSIVSQMAGMCALLDDATIKCWGNNMNGTLGIGTTTNRGNGVGLMGDNLPAVAFSSSLTPVELAGAIGATCARFEDATVRCWGLNAMGLLGTGDTANRGDDAGEVAALTAIDLGSGHSAKHIFGSNGMNFCALLDDDSLKCWGNNADANLGIGMGATDTDWGNATGEMGDHLPTVDLGNGVSVRTLSNGFGFRCAIMKVSTAVKCWGMNYLGQLGLETTYAAWGEYPDATMGDFLPYVRLGSIIPSTVTPTPTKTKTPTKTLSPSRTKSPTRTPTP